MGPNEWLNVRCVVACDQAGGRSEPILIARPGGTRLGPALLDHQLTARSDLAITFTLTLRKIGVVSG
jgi:hypothetical protein